MSSYEKIKQQENVWRNYSSMVTQGMGIKSGIPAWDPEADKPEYAPYYEKLALILDELGAGFPRPQDFKGEYARTVSKDADIQFLKTYWLPEHVKLGIHVPAHEYATTAQIADKAGIDEKEAEKLLFEMANRANIYHLEQEGVHTWRQLSPFPGQGAMSVGRLAGSEFWAGIEPYLQYYMRPAMFDMDAPSWRYVPLTDKEVAEGDRQVIEDYEVAERILMNADKVSVSSCICRAPKNFCEQTEPPFDVCLQINDFADFYVNDLKISRYMTKEEVKNHIERCKKEHLAILLSASKDAGIMCSCCNDGCCAPTNFFKKYAMGGPTTGRVTHFYVDVDAAKCTNCGICVERCYTNEGFKWNGANVEYRQENCVGCGVCVRDCPSKALILRLKDEKDRYDWPQTEFDVWDDQGKGSYGMKADYIERGRGTK